MAQMKRHVSDAETIRTRALFLDNSAGFTVQPVFATPNGYGGKLLRAYFVVTEDFVTTDIDLDIGTVTAAGVQTADSLYDGLTIVGADVNAPANITAIDVGIDVPVWLFGDDIDPNTTVIVTANDPGNNAGEGWLVIEYQFDQDDSILIDA
jgi:hypothetical protein